MLRVLLCEDDEEQLRYNRDYIEKIAIRKKEKCKFKSYQNPDAIDNEDLKWCNVAFLDIDFGRENISGIQLARKLLKINKWVAVVFITAYQEYTAEAFQIQAFGYLEKPIVRYELEGILDKISRYVSSAPQSNFIEVMHNKKLMFIKQQDIVYIEKVGKKATVCTIRNDIDTYEKISAIEKKLQNHFVKVNQGVIVNVEYICEMEDEMVCISTGERFKVSRSRLKEVSQKLSERSVGI